MNSEIRELILAGDPALVIEYRSIASYKLKEAKTSLFRCMIDTSFSESYKNLLKNRITLLTEIIDYIDRYAGPAE